VRLGCRPDRRQLQIVWMRLDSMGRLLVAHVVAQVPGVVRPRARAARRSSCGQVTLEVTGAATCMLCPMPAWRTALMFRAGVAARKGKCAERTKPTLRQISKNTPCCGMRGTLCESRGPSGGPDQLVTAAHCRSVALCCNKTEPRHRSAICVAESGLLPAR
jgi:hypothetical protein